MRRLILSIVMVAMFCSVALADEAKLKDLYAQYGQLQIQAEIINAQIQQVKQQIANEINKKPEVKDVEPVKE